MERKNLIRSALTVIGRSGLFNRAASRRGIRLAPLLLVAVMLAAEAVMAETSNPAQTVHAHDGDDHTHFDCSGGYPTYDDVSGEIPELWSATLTVGTRMSSGLTFLGWSNTGIYAGADLTDDDFTFGGDTYEIAIIQLDAPALTLEFVGTAAGDIATKATRSKLTLHVGSDSFNLGVGTLASNQRTVTWTNTGLSWNASDTVELRLTQLPTPNPQRLRLQDHLDGADDGGSKSKCSYGLWIYQPAQFVVRQFNQQPDRGRAGRNCNNRD